MERPQSALTGVGHPDEPLCPICFAAVDWGEGCASCGWEPDSDEEQES
jgi:hypothetical protein